MVSVLEGILLLLVRLTQFIGFHSSEWPTIPQLYVNGEFIGGCDIVLQMHESGELKELFKEVK